MNIFDEFERQHVKGWTESSENPEEITGDPLLGIMEATSEFHQAVMESVMDDDIRDSALMYEVMNGNISLEAAMEASHGSDLVKYEDSNIFSKLEAKLSGFRAAIMGGAVSQSAHNKNLQMMKEVKNKSFDKEVQVRDVQTVPKLNNAIDKKMTEMSKMVKFDEKDYAKGTTNNSKEYLNSVMYTDKMIPLIEARKDSGATSKAKSVKLTSAVINKASQDLIDAYNQIKSVEESLTTLSVNLNTMKINYGKINKSIRKNADKEIKKTLKKENAKNLVRFSQITQVLHVEIIAKLRIEKFRYAQAVSILKMAKSENDKVAMEHVHDIPMSFSDLLGGDY